MRPQLATLALPLLLAACAGEITQPTMAPAPPPPREATVVFPTEAQIAAGTPIRIRPAAVFGEYGVLQPLPAAPACGVLQLGRNPRPLPVSTPDGQVTPAFNIGGRCPRNDDGRGLPFVRMDQAWQLPDGIYMRGAMHQCLLPNVGQNAVCVRRQAS